MKKCLVCMTFEMTPALPAVDSAGTSTDEADRLCAPHRALFLEGECVLCGCPERWMAMHEDSDIAWCRRSYVDHLGEEFARDIEEDWERQDRRDGPDANVKDAQHRSRNS